MLASALTRARLHGLVTNRDLLVAILRDADLPRRSGQHRLLRPHLGDRVEHDDRPVGAPAAGRRPGRWREHDRPHAPCRRGSRSAGATSSPSRSAPRWPSRSARPAGRSSSTWPGSAAATATPRPTRTCRCVSVTPDQVVLEVGGVAARFAVAIDGDAVAVDGPIGSVALRAVPRFVDPAEEVASGSLLAPMPGSVVSSRSRTGAPVTAGDSRARARGDEDAAHDQRAHRRGRHRPRRRGAPGRGRRRAGRGS